jgi:bifunctional non-homologous end joining protein LigD
MDTTLDTTTTGLAEMATITPAGLMHATLLRQSFTAEGWVFENKLDGCRALVRKAGRAVELLSRSGRSMADQFPEIIRAAQAIPGGAILDAELVVLDERGHAMFERIRRRAVMRVERTIAAAAKAQPALLCVFDLLAVRWRDIRAEPLLQRKERLAALMPSAPELYLVPYIDAHGEALYRTAVEHGQEGIVGKWAHSPYRAGIQPTWRKIKNPEFHRKAALGIRQ